MVELPDDWRGMWVERDGHGAVIAAYGNPQPGIAEEPLAEDDAELVAFLTPPESPITVPYVAFEDRWAEEELARLHAAKAAHWQVERLYTRAVVQQHVNLTGEMAATAKTLFVSLGVLSQERADTIFLGDVD